MNQTPKVWTKILTVDLITVCFSVALTIIGQMIGTLDKAYALTPATSGWLLSVQSIGGFAATLICIIYIDAMGKKKVISLSAIALCAALIAVGIFMPLPLLFIVFVTLGFFTGIVKTMINAVMTETAIHNTEKHMTLMHFVFMIVAAIVPLASFALETSVGFSGVFLIIGTIALLFALFSVFSFRQSVQKKLIRSNINIGHRMQQFFMVLRIPGIKVLALVSLLISIWQIAVTYYTSSYLALVSGEASIGAFALSLLFFGMLLSRLIYLPIAGRFSEGHVLATTLTAGSILWIVMLLIPDVTVKLVLLALSAVLMGINIPLTYIAAGKLAPGNTATAAGIVSLGYYIALFVIPPVISIFRGIIGFDYALAIPGVLLALCIPFALQMTKPVRKAKSAA